MAASSVTTELSNSLNEFAFELYRDLGGDHSSNLFFSPYIIMAALAMTFAGANKETAKQMADVLKFNQIKDVHRSFQMLNEALLHPSDSYSLRSANRLYAQKNFGFLNGFLKTTEDNYKAGLFPVDFKTASAEARSAINDWVAEQTDDKIQNLIGEGVLNPLTVLVLVNAMYFKGKWVNEFKPRDNYVAKFKVSPSESIPVYMMSQKARFGYFEDKDRKCQVLTLPYVGDKLKMTIALPEASACLTDLEGNVTADVLSAWNKASITQKVDVKMPRFKLETSFILNDQLAAMGMKDLFDDTRADLSGITGATDLYISKVIHKAFVEVNEKGTVAAAATAGAITLSAVMDEPPIFRADRPFLFFISDNSSGAVLFVGRLVNPRRSTRRDEL